MLGDLHPFQNVLALQKPNYIEDELVVGDRTLALYLTPFSDKAQGGVLILLHDVRNSTGMRNGAKNSWPTCLTSCGPP